MRPGTRDKLRDIDNGSCYEALGNNLSKSLLGFYVFTGRDQIGRFSGKSKSMWWNNYAESNNTITDAFWKHGDSENLRALEKLESLEKVVVKAYGECPASISSLS